MVVKSLLVCHACIVSLLFCVFFLFDISCSDICIMYQGGPAPGLIKAEIPWSARRGSLSEKDRVLKTVKGY